MMRSSVGTRNTNVVWGIVDGDVAAAAICWSLDEHSTAYNDRYPYSLAHNK